MMDLDTLSKSISEMTEDELIARIASIRAERKAPQHIGKKTKAAPQKNPLEGMTIEQLQALLAKTEEA